MNNTVEETKSKMKASKKQSGGVGQKERQAAVLKVVTHKTNTM